MIPSAITKTSARIKKTSPSDVFTGSLSRGVGKAESTGITVTMGTGVGVVVGDGVKHAFPVVAKQAMLVAFAIAQIVRVAYSCVAWAVMVSNTEARVAASTVAVASL